MQSPDLSDTQPVRVHKAPAPAEPASQGSAPQSPPSPRPASSGPKTRPRPPLPPSALRKRARRGPVVVGILVCLALLGVSMLTGALAGYRSAVRARDERQSSQAGQLLQEQYQLGLQDLQTGQYQVARQRFEYILAQDPNFPGATDGLAQVMAILYATATPTAVPPTPTATATPDPRPVQDLFTSAMQHFASQDWNATIDTLVSLRKADPSFMTPRVDGMLFISLRSRGIDKILKQSNLEGGIYDLSLAEQFSPIDVEASQARELARLYMFGLAFWEVYPERSVFFFGQVAAAAPYLSDSSGYTATERYHDALIQYGDQLVKQSQWCEAQAQYELALAIRADTALQETLKEITLRCIGATPTSPVTVTPTPTVTGVSPTAPVFSLTPTATSTTQVVGPTATSTATATQSVDPTATSTATIESPVDTPTPTPTPTNTNTAPYPGPATGGAYQPPALEIASLLLSLAALLSLALRYGQGLLAWLVNWL